MSTRRRPQPSDFAAERDTGPPDSGEETATERLLKVGEIAEQTGKTVRALRFYEELGLLVPVQRTKGGFRLYDETALVRVHWIDRLQELGFSLPEIGEFLSALRSEDRGPAAMDALRSFYARKLLDTRQSIRRLQALESELHECLGFLSGCQQCAPETHRSACRTCDDATDGERHQPPLVAAVHGPD